MILVTGGTGLVGAHLLFDLVKKGDKVRAIYRASSKIEAVKKVFEYYTSDPETLFKKIEWVEADITDLPGLSDAFQGVEIVYHCAALISFDPSDYFQLRKANIEGTHHIVNLCISHKVKKLCYVSSIAAIGKPEPSNAVITEETSWNPEADNNVYAITKFGAEMEVWRGTQEGVNAVIVNPGVILGSGFWHQGSGVLLKLVKKGIPFYPYGSTGFVDVLDVTRLMIELMQSNIKNERFIVVSENLVFGDVFKRIAKKINVPPPTKSLKVWQLKLAWRLDWLRSTLTGKKRKLTRWTVQSLTTQDTYSNNKIKSALDYTFIPMEETLDRVCAHFSSD